MVKTNDWSSGLRNQSEWAAHTMHITLISPFLYFILYENLGAFFVTLLVSIINIFFSFINYKFILFKTPKKYFFKEYLKINFFQFNMILINTFLLWISIEKLNINIYIRSITITIIKTFRINY